MLAADAVCSTQQEVAAAIAAHIGSKATASMPAEECCLRKVGPRVALRTQPSPILMGCWPVATQEGRIGARGSLKVLDSSNLAACHA